MIHKLANKTGRMIMESEQAIFDRIVDKDHPFRRLLEIIDFEPLIEPLKECYSHLGTAGIPIEIGVKALLVQFWENYSDREMERCMRENMAVRWFCNVGLTEKTPDHSYFGKLRDRIGTSRLASLFNHTNAQLRAKGLFGDTFTFIDASSLITKTALWKERDKAIEDGYEKLNNTVVSNYAADKDALWGSKGVNKFWFGYKRHNAVDMRYGLIEKVCVTPANVLDYEVVEQICPSGRLVFQDKLYDTKETDIKIRAAGSTPATIRKNNNPNKNKDLDRWRSKIRMPFEGTFSKQGKRTRYRSRVKVTFQCFAEALVHNLKKAVRYAPAHSMPSG